MGAVSLETGLVWASGAWALAFPPSPLESPRIPSNPFLRHSGWNPAQRWGSPRDHLKPRKAPVTTKTAEIDAFLKDSLVLKAIPHISNETLLFRAWQAFCANGVFGLPPEVGQPKLPKDPVVVLNMKRSPPCEFSHAGASAPAASVVMRGLQSGRACGKPKVFRHDIVPRFNTSCHSPTLSLRFFDSQTLRLSDYDSSLEVRTFTMRAV